MRRHDSAEHDAAAELYDQAVEFWIRTLRAEGLLVTARKAVPLAQPCANDFAKGGMYSQDNTVSRMEVRRCPSRRCPSALLPVDGEPP